MTISNCITHWNGYRIEINGKKDATLTSRLPIILTLPNNNRGVQRRREGKRRFEMKRKAKKMIMGFLMFIVIGTALNILMASDLQAAGNWYTGTIVKVFTHSGEQYFRISLKQDSGEILMCNGDIWIFFEEDAPISKMQYATVLSAQALNQTVAVWVDLDESTCIANALLVQK